MSQQSPNESESASERIYDASFMPEGEYVDITAIGDTHRKLYHLATRRVYQGECLLMDNLGRHTYEWP